MPDEEEAAQQAWLDEIEPIDDEAWAALANRLGNDVPVRQLELAPVSNKRLPGLGLTPVRIPPGAPPVPEDVDGAIRCRRCGTKFLPDRKTQEYCSNACRQAGYRKRRR